MYSSSEYGANLGIPSMVDLPDTTDVVACSRTTGPIPVLKNGDRLTRCEFERRYAACPDLEKAQLVEGVVYMPSPVSLAHSGPHAMIHTVLLCYAAYTPGVRGEDNATVRLDFDNAPQPDVLLRIVPEASGQTRVSDDGYLEGAPELIVEVAASRASIDLHDKLRAYRRNGVREYVVWRTGEQRIDWLELVDGEYRPLSPDGDGVVHSRVFPGLRVAAGALLRDDLAGALAALNEGLGSPEHRRFVARLSEAIGHRRA